MKRLTAKEEEIMEWYWAKGPLFVKQLLEFYPDPKPHFNTLSTIVRSLETQGFLSHNAFGNTYQYFPTVTAEQYHKQSLKDIIRRYFNNSGISAVSALVKEEDISVEELRDLIKEVERS